MNKFKSKNNNRFIRLFYILVILFIILIIFFKNLDINYVILKSVKSKFDDKVIDTDKINTKLVYNSLNKIIVDEFIDKVYIGNYNKENKTRDIEIEWNFEF